MSAPDQSATATTTEPTGWDEDDVQALLASVFWLDLRAPPELIAQYQGKHIAVFGEQIIGADADADTLYSRLGADGIVPINRVYIRYIPTEEEAWQRIWIH